MKQPTHTGHLKGDNFKYLASHNINASSCQSHKILDRLAPSESSRAKEKSVSAGAVSGRAGKTDGKPMIIDLSVFSLSISYA
jgi:hypothetical protein